MANITMFHGANFTYTAPKGQEDRIAPMPVMKTPHFITSCWELGQHEFEEVLRTGRVYLTILATDQIPAFVGGELSTRALTADYGKALPKQTPQKVQP